jgi:hypothetical protein
MPAQLARHVVLPRLWTGVCGWDEPFCGVHHIVCGKRRAGDLASVHRRVLGV